MAKIEPVDAAAEDGPDVVQVAATVVAEAATAAAAAFVDENGEQLSRDFQMDPAYTTSEQFQKALKSDAASKSSRDATQTLKTGVLISGVVLAVVGAIFAISKKSKKVS